MFFPVGTDRRQRHLPWVNYGLVAANIAIFLLSRPHMQRADQLAREIAKLHQEIVVYQANYQALAQRLPPGHILLQGVEQEIAWRQRAIEARERAYLDNPVRGHYLTPGQVQPLQFLSYQFLHDGWMHLIGNMLFLFVFGNSVEDRLGKIGYLLFYLAGGALAGLGHVLMSPAPVLGASGAVCAVTGAFMALFPLSNVTIVYFFIFIGAFEISGIYLIAFQWIRDFIMHLAGAGGVAYGAHLAGYVYGFAIGMGLLRLGILAREPCDLLTLLEHRRRRQQFRALTRKGFQPWESASGTPAAPGGGGSAPLTEAEKRIMADRAAINAALAQHDPATAADLYLGLLAQSPDQVLGQQQQLDLANQLMTAGRHEAAARAYELFLKVYGRYAQREQIELILALVYARYLKQPQRAGELARSALTRLTDPQQRALAEQLLKPPAG